MQSINGRIFNIKPGYVKTPEDNEFITIFRNKDDGKYYGRKSDGSDELISGPGSADKNFVFQQIVSAIEWVVVHNLGKKCSVTIVDDLGSQMYAKVVYDNNNQVSIYFNKSKTGFVYCN